MLGARGPGIANGFGGGDAKQTYVTGYSAFTVNTRTAPTSTSFDKRLFTVLPDGNVSSSGTMSCTGVLYINCNPASNPGSSGYACLWNQGGIGPRLSGDNMSLTTGAAPTTERMSIDSSCNVGIGTGTPQAKLQVLGDAVDFTNTGGYAVPNNFMQAESLTIGDLNLNYGNGTNSNSNTAGLLMECLDNTEIAVHDSGKNLGFLQPIY